MPPNNEDNYKLAFSLDINDFRVGNPADEKRLRALVGVKIDGRPIGSDSESARYLGFSPVRSSY